MKEGWEYKKLGEIATEMYRGSGIKRDQVTKEGTPCVRYGEIYTTYNISFDTCASHTKIENVTSPKYFEYGDLLFAITGESVEDIGKTIAYLGDEKCLCGGDIICMKHHQNPKYLAYALSTPDAIRQKGIGKTKLKVVHTNAPALKAISIPLAPLSEQQSIVDYLDSAFAKIDAMKANAEKALNEAKALFQASLKEMLEPKEGWEEKKLKDFATEFYRGSGVKRDQVTEKGISCVRYGEIYTKYNYHFNKCDSHTLAEYVSSPKYFENGDILFAITGESVEEIGKSIAYTGNEKCIAGGDIVVMKHTYEPRYISYALSTPSAVKQKGRGKTKLKVVHTNIPSLEEIIIPIAPMNDQIRIADTLDSLKSKVDRLQENYDKISQECDALKQAILRQVFE